MNRKRLVVVAGAIALSAPFGVHTASAVDPVPPTSCEISRLPVPKQGETSVARNGDAAGRYLVGSQSGVEQEQDRALLWDDGELEAVDLSGFGDAFTDVNDDGVAVGWADGGASTPFVYSGGEPTVLPLDSDEGNVSAINPNGDIAGTRYLPPEDPDTIGIRSLPARWRTDAGADAYTMEALPVPDGTTKVATGGIADDGTVVGVDGTYLPDSDTYRNVVYAWSVDGKRYRLPKPAGTTVREASIIVAGTKVAGDVSTEDGTTWSVLWDLEDLAEPVMVSRVLDHVYDVNANGWVAGSTTNDTGGFASLEGGDVELPSLDDNPDQADGAAWSINGDGTVLGGTSHDSNGDGQAVVWSCS